jgi:hypothetical protein
LHRHSATGQEGSPFKSFHLGRNKVWLVIKNYPFRVLWHHVLLVILYDLAAVVYALVARRDVHALRGRVVGLMTGGKMWAKRTAATSSSAKRLDLDWLERLPWPWHIPRRYKHIVPRSSGPDKQASY